MLKQVSVFIENRPGALARVCAVLKDNAVNMRALSLADTQQFGILRMLVRDHEAVAEILKKAGFVVKLADVIILCVPDRAGGLADVMEVLDRRGLSVEYMYAFPVFGKDKAAIVFRFSDPETAEKVLREENVEIFVPDEGGAR